MHYVYKSINYSLLTLKKSNFDLTNIAIYIAIHFKIPQYIAIQNFPLIPSLITLYVYIGCLF